MGWKYPLAVLLVSAPAGAFGDPNLDWWTIETRHFRFHYPAELDQWTRHVAARALDSHRGVGGTVLVQQAPSAPACSIRSRMKASSRRAASTASAAGQRSVSTGSRRS